MVTISKPNALLFRIVNFLYKFKLLNCRHEAYESRH